MWRFEMANVLCGIKDCNRSTGSGGLLCTNHCGLVTDDEIANIWKCGNLIARLTRQPVDIRAIHKTIVRLAQRRVDRRSLIV